MMEWQRIIAGSFDDGMDHCKRSTVTPLVDIIKDIIASSDANDGESLANAINAAKEFIWCRKDVQ